MREKLRHLASEKRVVGVNFNAASEAKLVSVSGTIVEVGGDFMTLQDIYGNTMLIPFMSVAYIEIRR